MTASFSAPLTASGRSASAPPPPWHYVGDFCAVDFWASADAVTSLLPPGIEPADDPGRCAIFFSDCQYATDGGDELIEPAVCQYRECMVVITGKVDGKLASSVPFIFVDNDNSLVRGQIQGMPKQLGVVRMTRSYTVASPANPGLEVGSRFGATCSYRDRLAAKMTLALTEITDHAPNRIMARLINRRHMPDLRADRHHIPLVSDLVRQKVRSVAMSPVWSGAATLSLYDSEVHEIGMLAPKRVGRGYRYTMAMTIDDLSLFES